MILELGHGGSFFIFQFMRLFLSVISLICIFLASCSDESPSDALKNATEYAELGTIPAREVNVASLDFDNKTSLWKLNNTLYSGFAVSFYEDSTKKECIGILDGKKENLSLKWYPDGRLKLKASYHKGKLHGNISQISCYPIALRTNRAAMVQLPF